MIAPRSSSASSRSTPSDPLIPHRRSLPPLEFELLSISTSPSGLPRLRIKPARLQYKAYVDVQESAPVNPSRLQEIVARLGEICLTPELIHVVLFPEEAHAGSTVNAFACNTPALAIGFMDDPRSSDTRDWERRLLNAGRFLTAFQSRCLPPPTLTTLRNPLHLCAWRLETPPRVCLYTGEHPLDPRTLDLSAHLPHTLSKILLEDRSKRPTPSRIHLLHQSEDIDNDHTPDAIRTSLLHYAQTSLTSYRERLPLAKTTAQDHTLEEAFASLIHPPTRNHTLIALNQSPPWDKDHVDSRYTHENKNSTEFILLQTPSSHHHDSRDDVSALLGALGRHGQLAPHHLGPGRLAVLAKHRQLQGGRGGEICLHHLQHDHIALARVHAHKLTRPVIAHGELAGTRVTRSDSGRAHRPQNHLPGRSGSDNSSSIRHVAPHARPLA